MTAPTVASTRFIQTLEDLLGRGHAVRFQADGWSMHPTIRHGEVIIVEPVTGAALRANDVLLYRHKRGAMAHRLVSITSSSGEHATFILRGDAADTCDAPITRDQVIGRVIAVERDGRIVRFGGRGAFFHTLLARALRRFRVYRGRVAEAVTIT